VDPLIINLPSSVKLQSLTAPLWPFNMVRDFAFLAFYTTTVLSSEAERRNLLSEEKVTLSMTLV